MRTPKPYHKHIGKGKKAKGRGWYANIGPNKRPVRLASEEEGEAKAWERYYQIMADRQPVESDGLVLDLLERFLAHHAKKSAPATYRFYFYSITLRE